MKRRLPEVGAHSRTLEVGAGRGSIGARLAARGPYIGVEPDVESRRAAGDAIGSAGSIVGHLDEVEPVAFDLLCSFEVLEHIEDDLGALRSWVERLEPCAHVIVSVPAHRKRFSHQDVRVGHHRRYDPTDLEQLLADAGLSDVHVEPYGFPLGYVLEAVRNRMAARELATASDTDRAELTAESGRYHQPPAWSGVVVQLGTLPFRLLQRAARRTNLGPGLIGTGRVPS
ncbi:MAG: class I SAM-dependent methyltransferase [Acidimicrobiia bacterium]|nr:class I SAM-dependent methyltransferase [Acidimicrobiia bacterium]